VDLGINGKTALVTGAGRGLGAAISRSLAKEGVKLIICSRTKSELELLKNELSHPQNHKLIDLDLSKDLEIFQLIDFIKNSGSSIDILINNVGGTLNVNDPFQSIEDFRSVMQLNLDVAVTLNSFILPRMQEQKWGRVCHISSISALENQGPPAYCASKAALNAYIRSIGRYVAKDNVVVTGVMPGAVFTRNGYWDSATVNRSDHVKKFLNERMAIGRFGREEEISDLVAFMVSEQASFLVGSILLADGGQGRTFQNSWFE
jgi:3-oxoacyl-[acyl-carrier protein] reductase